MVITKWIPVSLTYAMLLMMSAGFCLANCTNSTIENAENLFNTTILSVDHRLRPTLDMSKPTTVYVSLILVSLVDVDEVHQFMASNILLTVTWLDELRQWNSSAYGGLNKVHPDPLDVWRPRLFLTNALAQRDVFDNSYAPLTIYNTGHTEWLPGGLLYSSCSMQMTYFPFDTQTCTLSFTAGEICDSVDLVADYANISQRHYDRNGEWIIQSYEVVSRCLRGVSNVQFAFKLNRMPSFSLLNIVIPVNIISSLSSLVFVMPAGSGERVSFSITVLLSLTVYTGEISKELPTDSESMPLLIMYLASLLLHSAFCIVVNLIVLIQRYHHTGTVSRRKEKPTHSAHSTFSHSFAPNDSVFSTVNSGGVCLLKLRKSTFDIDDQESTCSTSAIDSPQVNRRKLTTRFEQFLWRLGLHKNYTNNNNVGNGKMYLLTALMSSVLKYIRLVDIFLFVLFFGVWLMITIVFMSLMAYGGPQRTA